MAIENDPINEFRSRWSSQGKACVVRRVGTIAIVDPNQTQLGAPSVSRPVHAAVLTFSVASS
jgi:hypothetical protein